MFGRAEKNNAFRKGGWRRRMGVELPLVLLTFLRIETCCPCSCPYRLLDRARQRACYIAARPRKPRDKAVSDWISCDRKGDWDCRGRAFGRENRRGATTSQNHIDFAADEIGSQGIVRSFVYETSVMVDSSSSSCPSRSRHRRHGEPVCLAAASGQAPRPPSGVPKARGLTAKLPPKRSSALP
jgi:hypothetical protein